MVIYIVCIVSSYIVGLTSCIVYALTKKKYVNDRLHNNTQFYNYKNVNTGRDYLEIIVGGVLFSVFCNEVFIFIGILFPLILYLCFLNVRNRLEQAIEEEKGFVSQFQTLQTSYEEARQKAKDGDALTFSELPVFPFKTPYDALQEQKHEQLQTRSDSDLDDLTNQYFENVRKLMPELLYMRGDEHEASGDDSRVLLAIKEVAQAERELAVVAVVVLKLGKVVSVSIRRSGWPSTIYKDAPRSRNNSTSNARVSYDNDYDWFYHRYFAPIAWENARAVGTRNTVRAVFANETNETAEAIANAVYEWFRLEFRDR